MATEVIAGPLGERRAASTAGGGTALTTTAVRIVLPLGTKAVTLTPRNASGANVLRFNFNPWLTILKTTDLLATQAALTDYSQAAQDGSTATSVVLSSLGALSASDALYVGSHLPFLGVEVDVDAANGTASVLTVAYWNGTAWTDTSATDGTASGGATFAVDGNITFTMPTDWVTTDLFTTQPTTALRGLGILTEPLYWLRFVVSVALDSSTTLDSMIAINRSTVYDEFPFGMWDDQSVTVGPGGVCSVTALTDAGTGNLIVSCATRQNGRFA